MLLVIVLFAIPKRSYKGNRERGNAERVEGRWDPIDVSQRCWLSLR